MKSFKRVHTPNELLNRVQDNMSLFADALVKIPLLDGILVKDVALGTTEVRVNHTLGREPQGWIIVKKNAAADIYESSSTLADRYLSLTATATVTASIWIF